ncbi:MAG: hypothetical protein H7831_17555 [Magnetococcus sp. WYHC-3]
MELFQDEIEERMVGYLNKAVEAGNPSAILDYVRPLLDAKLPESVQAVDRALAVAEGLLRGPWRDEWSSGHYSVPLL